MIWKYCKNIMDITFQKKKKKFLSKGRLCSNFPKNFSFFSLQFLLMSSKRKKRKEKVEVMKQWSSEVRSEQDQLSWAIWTKSSLQLIVVICSTQSETVYTKYVRGSHTRVRKRKRHFDRWGVGRKESVGGWMKWKW